MTDSQRNEPTRLGYYRDPANGDMWHLSESGWSWVNGNRWSHLPENLECTCEPNPFRAAYPPTAASPDA